MRANTIIVPVVCFAIGAAFGIFFFNKGSHANGRASADADPAATNSKPLGSALPGNGQSGSKKQAKLKASNRTRSATLNQMLALTDKGVTTSTRLELFRLTEALDTDALLQLAAEIAQLPTNDQRAWPLRDSVLGSLAKKDPDAAVAHVLAISNHNTRSSGLSIVMNEILQQDEGKAFDLLRGIEDKLLLKQVASSLASSGSPSASATLFAFLKERKDINIQWGYNQLFANWARHDLGAALASLDQIAPGADRTYALQGIGQSITAENLDVALETLEALPGGEKSLMLQSLLGNLVATDSSKALELLDTHATGAQRRNMITNLATGWMNSDPESAKAWIETLENPQDRLSALQNLTWNENGQTKWLAEQIKDLPIAYGSSHLFSNIVTRWAQNDPKTAAQWVDSLPAGSARQSARSSLIGEWAHGSPDEAAEYFKSTLEGGPVGMNDANVAGQIASRLASRDPQSAIEWMESLEASQNVRANVISNMVSQWVHTDPPAAAAYVMGLDGKDHEQGISTLLSSWAHNDFDAAEAFASQLSDPDLRQRALSSLISGSAHSDPERAATALATATANLGKEEIEQNFGSSTSNIAHSWANSDPRAAAAWAVNLPDGNNRPQALQNIVRAWASYEPKAASEWLMTFEPSPERDGAIAGLVTQISNTDPEAAFIWAASMSDENRRSSVIQRAINQWQSIDADAARAAVESSDLGDEIRQQLLDSFPGTVTLPDPHPGAVDDPFGS